MAEKDITEKILEDYNDVFADIVNVLLFDGERVVNEDELFNETTNSYYKAGRKIRGQDRDVAKKWIHNTIHMSMYGFENETSYEKNMPMRIIGYDGASYRNQLTRENNDKPNYPIVTMVLYFGMSRWGSSRSLKDCFTIPDRLKEFVSDYKINVFEIAYLSDRQVKMFKSDFKFIADYFVQLRKTGKYVPMSANVKHLWETLNLLSVLSSDDRFEKSYAKFKGKEDVNMYSVVDDFINQGINQEKEESAVRMIQDGGLPLEKIAMYSGLTMERVIMLEKANGFTEESE